MGESPYHVGLLIHDSSSEYSQAMISGVTECCKKLNFALYIFIVGEFGVSYGRFDYQKRAIASLISKNNLDGLLFTSATQGNHVSKETLINYLHSFDPLPIVSIGYDIPTIPSLIVDCTTGMKSLVNHLIQKHNCQRIALMGVDNQSPEVLERTNAYKEALNENGIEFDPSIVMYGAFTYTHAKVAIKTYTDKYWSKYPEKKNTLNFDAIVALNDDMAFACIDFCREFDLQIPDDIIITGFDDITRASQTKPTLTSVNQQIFDQGILAVETLQKLLNDKKVDHIQKINTKAIYRQTCGCISKTDWETNCITQEGERRSHKQRLGISNISEWHIKKSQLIRIINYNGDTQASMDLTQFRNRVNNDLSQFEISSAAICIYETPVIINESFTHFRLPDKAIFLSAFDNSTGFSTDSLKEPIHFNPRDMMIPPNTFIPQAKRNFVVALSHCEIQYGYFIFTAGDFDDMLYDMMCTIISTALSSAFEYTKSINERKILSENNRLLNTISRTDEMTQLLNRRGFMALGQQSLNIGIEMQQTGLVVFGDMDGLKVINDTYGHDAGDRAIKAEALLLRSIFRTTDVIGRLGGDEFAIVATGLTDTSFTRIRTKLKKLCSEWNEKSGEKFTLSISMGSAKFSSEEYNLNTLLQLADAAQYEEKRLKKVDRK